MSYESLVLISYRGTAPRTQPKIAVFSRVLAGAYDPTVGASGGVRQGRGFAHVMAHPDIERGRPRQVHTLDPLRSISISSAAERTPVGTDKQGVRCP